jgi:hypothetical protein
MNDCYKELVDNPLSNRVMQVYGAACMVKFCAVHGIYSPGVDQLVKYLLELLSTNDLPEWEQAGSILELSGRENELPDDPAELLSARDRILFKKLLESVIEIGISDMYGADTDGPIQAVCEVRRILEKCGIEPPSIAGLYAIAHSQRGWGEPLSDNQVQLLEAWCLNHYGDLSPRAI